MRNMSHYTGFFVPRVPLVLGVLQLCASAHSAIITVQTDREIRTIDRSQLLGQNIALWYNPSILNGGDLVEAFHDAGIGAVRIPGGSWSDWHFWNGNGVRTGTQVDTSKYQNYEWDIDYSDWAPGFNAQFIPQKPNTPEVPNQVVLSVKDLHEFIRRVGCGTMAVVNAGTGNARLAAEWVRWANLKQGYKVEHWEVGNELEGGWEPGHIRPDGSSMTGEAYAKIFDEFARAMREVDPSIKIGGPAGGSPDGGAEMLHSFLTHAKEPIDFISCHIYSRNRPDTLTGWAEVAKNTFKEVARLREILRTYRPERADKIEIHLTEFNIWPQGSPTVTMEVGIWTSVVLGELLKGEVDYCWFWDALTVNHATGQGHGFLYPSKKGVIRKSQYWAFYIFHHYFGNRILQTENEEAPTLYTYAAYNEKDELCVIVVNASEKPEQASIRLGGSKAKAYPAIRVATFAAMEYNWPEEDNDPLWAAPPNQRRLTPAQLSGYSFPSASITSFVFSRPKKLPTLLVEGQDPIRLPCGVKTSLHILVLDAKGQPAKGIPVAIRSQKKAVVPARTPLKTGADGTARILLDTARKEVLGELILAAKMPNGKVIEKTYPVQTLLPRLEIIAPEAVPEASAFPIMVLLHGGTNEYGAPIPFDIPPQMVGIRTGTQKETMPLCEGEASTTWIPRRKGKLNLSASMLAYHLTTRKPLTVYAEKEHNTCMLDFEDEAGLRAISGKTSFKIDETIRPNQGVLAVQGLSGKTRLSIKLGNLPDQELFRKIQPKITGFSIDIHFGKKTKIPEDARLGCKIDSAANGWKDSPKISPLRPGKWKTIHVSIPEDRLSEFTQIHSVHFTLEQMEEPPEVYFDNFTLFYKDR